MHPAHVPLEAEAQAALGGGPGDALPRGRLLGDRDRAGHPLVDGGVHLLQELHGLEVLAAAVHVGRPLAGLPGVVEVEHRGDGVDPQAVDVELLEPVERVGDQEVADLAAPEVEDERAPVGVLPARRVRVLVERGAVEAGQRELVLGEVRGHPVDEDADAGLVQPVDEVAEAVGVAEARGGREVRRDLVAPRAAERVLHDRHELDVGEAEVGDVVDEAVGHLLVGVRAAAVVLLPRAEVHLVDRHRPRRAAAARRGRPSTRRRSRCTSTRRPPTTWPAGPRCGTPSGRPSRATARRPRGWRTCSRCRCRRPGTNSSQTPEVPSWRIGCSRPSQLLNDALSRIPRACGAQTANDVPVTPPS